MCLEVCDQMKKLHKNLFPQSPLLFCVNCYNTLKLRESYKFFCLVMDIDFVLDYNLLVQVYGYQALTNHIYIHPDQQQLDNFCKRFGPGLVDEEKFTVKSGGRFYNIIKKKMRSSVMKMLSTSTFQPLIALCINLSSNKDD